MTRKKKRKMILLDNEYTDKIFYRIYFDACAYIFRTNLRKQTRTSNCKSVAIWDIKLKFSLRLKNNMMMMMYVKYENLAQVKWWITFVLIVKNKLQIIQLSTSHVEIVNMSRSIWEKIKELNEMEPQILVCKLATDHPVPKFLKECFTQITAAGNSTLWWIYRFALHFSPPYLVQCFFLLTFPLF